MGLESRACLNAAGTSAGSRHFGQLQGLPRDLGRMTSVCRSYVAADRPAVSMSHRLLTLGRHGDPGWVAPAVRESRTTTCLYVCRGYGNVDMAQKGVVAPCLGTLVAHFGPMAVPSRGNPMDLAAGQIVECADYWRILVAGSSYIVSRADVAYIFYGRNC